MAEEEYEYFEMEVPEEDIVCYLVDEDDKEVGFVVMEDGEEVEYFYADEEGVEYVYADSGEAAGGADGAASAQGEGGARESRIKPLSSVAAAGGTTANDAPKDKIDQTTDKVIEHIKSDEFKSAARDFGVFAQETADATKELREVYRDVKDTIDMFNPKKIFK